MSAFAIASAGCSDSAPAPAQGAFTARFGNAIGVACPATTPSAQLQVGSFQGNQHVPVVDGEDGAAVSCTVAPYQDGFTASGNIQLGNSSFYMSGVKLGGSLPNEGVVVLSGPNTVGAYSPADGSTCSFTVTSIEAGRVWASFRCPHVVVPGKSGSDCNVDDGIVVLENCSTE
jgi:hypothetical protein